MAKLTFKIVRGRILNRLTYILGKKGTKRKAVQDITNRTMVDSQLNKTANGADGDSAAGPSNEIDLNHYAPFFREWDLSVFKILTYQVVEISSEPSEEEEHKDPKLRPPEFLMIMKDLNLKLDHILVATKTKKSFPGKIFSSYRVFNMDLGTFYRAIVASILVSGNF